MYSSCHGFVLAFICPNIRRRGQIVAVSILSETRFNLHVGSCDIRPTYLQYPTICLALHTWIYELAWLCGVTIEVIDTQLTTSNIMGCGRHQVLTLLSILGLFYIQPSLTVHRNWIYPLDHSHPLTPGVAFAAIARFHTMPSSIHHQKRSWHMCASYFGH